MSRTFAAARRLAEALRRLAAMRARALVPTVAAIAVAGGVAFAANTTFFTSIGDLVFPFSPPSGSNPGTIDNMTIGATAPQNVTAKALSSTGAATLSPANANVTLSPTGTGQVVVNPATAGTVDNVVIGGTTPLAGTFTDETSTTIKLDTGTKTAAATAGAATLNKNAGVITTEALSTAAGATYTLTLTNSTIAAADQVFASVAYGTSTTGSPAVTRVTPGSNQVVISVQNVHASAALNGTLQIAFARLKN